MPWIDDDRYLNQAEKENNANIVILTYHNLGLNDYTIASLLANMDAESTLSPCLTERGSSNPRLWSSPVDAKKRFNKRL